MSAAGAGLPAGSTAAVTAEDWDAAYAEPAGRGTAEELAEPVFGDVGSWVEQHLVLLVARQLGAGATWCARWWAHAEAISRLESLWRAWEVLRLDETLGMSLWWRDHADPHLAVLLSRDAGPFAACTPQRHVDLPPLPSAAAPAGWWGVPEDTKPDGGFATARPGESADEQGIR